jgi:hypothetical protein
MIVLLIALLLLKELDARTLQQNDVDSSQLQAAAEAVAPAGVLSLLQYKSCRLAVTIDCHAADAVRLRCVSGIRLFTRQLRGRECPFSCIQLRVLLMP